MCNGIDDCRKGSDEWDCDTIVTPTTPKPPKGGCNTDLEFECNIDYCQRLECSDFQCLNDDGVPVPSSKSPCSEFVCSDYQCINTTTIAPTKCKQFKCTTYFCMEYFESNTTENGERKKMECEDFTCMDDPPSSDPMCIPKEQKCDRNVDCPGGWDERPEICDCYDNEFTCDVYDPPLVRSEKCDAFECSEFKCGFHCFVG